MEGSHYAHRCLYWNGLSAGEKARIMQIIVLGAGQVGGSLAETLLAENHDITLVDINEKRLKEYADRLDIRTILGRCSYPDVLRQAGADDADMIIAVTDSDEANMVACQVAYSLFNIPTKIARIRSEHYFIRKELFGKENLPIDVFIAPEQLVTQYVTQLILHPGALQVLEFGGGLVKLVAVQPYYGGTLIGKTISEFDELLPSVRARIVALFRDNCSVELKDDTVIDIGDEIFFIAAADDVADVMGLFRRAEAPYQRVMIAGGGNIGRCLAQELQKCCRVKIIDHNHKRCEDLAADLDHATVLCGEVSDENLLTNENIEHTDAFVAVTNDDEANIIASLQAKRLGVKQAMALMTRRAYVDLIEGGQINIAISPQQITVGSILAYIRKGDVRTVYSLRRGAAEAIEAVAHGDKKTSKVVGKRIGDIKIPKETIIGAILRGDMAMIPDEDTVIESEDHVILLVGDKKRIREVGKLFQVSAGFF